MLISFLHQVACSRHFKEAVTVLWSELDGKVEIEKSILKTKVTILCTVGHADSCSFAPDFSTFWNLPEGLFEGVEYLIEVSPGTCSRVLQLNKNCPKSSSGEVDLKTVFNYLLRLVEVTTSHVHHDCFELDLPLALEFVLGLDHDLKSTVSFADGFEVLCVLKKGV